MQLGSLASVFLPTLTVLTVAVQLTQATRQGNKSQFLAPKPTLPSPPSLTDALPSPLSLPTLPCLLDPFPAPVAHPSFLLPEPHGEQQHHGKACLMSHTPQP